MRITIEIPLLSLLFTLQCFAKTAPDKSGKTGISHLLAYPARGLSCADALKRRHLRFLNGQGRWLLALKEGTVTVEKLGTPTLDAIAPNDILLTPPSL